MCNRYFLGSLEELRADDIVKVLPEWKRAAVFPRNQAPTILADGECRLMQFGLAAKPNGPAYNNARILTPTKWPWLKSIESRRCVIPLS